MSEEKTYTEEELKNFFELQSALLERARDIAKICTDLTSHEEITGMWLDEFPPVTVRIGVWSSDCGNDSYDIPVQYFSMTIDEIKAEEKKRLECARRRAQEEEKRQKKEEERAERREYKRLKKKFEGALKKSKRKDN